MTSTRQLPSAARRRGRRLRSHRLCLLDSRARQVHLTSHRCRCRTAATARAAALRRRGSCPEQTWYLARGARFALPAADRAARRVGACRGRTTVRAAPLRYSSLDAPRTHRRLTATWLASTCGPPDVHRYAVRVKPAVLKAFAEIEWDSRRLAPRDLEDEFMWRNSFPPERHILRVARRKARIRPVARSRPARVQAGWATPSRTSNTTSCRTSMRTSGLLTSATLPRVACGTPVARTPSWV
jgi:hypothetical protein